MILLNEYVVDFGRFPNGESNLNFNKLAFSTKSTITLKYESDQDLFNLFILKKYLDEYAQFNRFDLTILYMPYSRMDRHNIVYTFNLKYVCTMINDMNFASVTVYDAHSDVTGALLNRYIEGGNIPILFKQFQEEVGTDNLVIMYPDAGAQKRYSKDYNYPTVVGNKIRNFETGNIDSYEIYGEDVKGKNVVIIDDLCSKGGTFIGAAKALRERGAKDVYLIVGHCENTVYDGDLFSHITKMYTTNTILSDINIARQIISKEQLTIIPSYVIKSREEGY